MQKDGDKESEEWIWLDGGEGVTLKEGWAGGCRAKEANQGAAWAQAQE